jgi:enamine deaminase RidA (YjgF/YER057c/UK114 family)
MGDIRRQHHFFEGAAMKRMNRAVFMRAGAAAIATLGLSNISGRRQNPGSDQRTSQVEQRLKEMGLSLPEAPKPVGAYIAARRSGNLLFISLQFPYVEGKVLFVGGRVGREVSIEQGQAAFRACALNVLAQAKQNLGSLDRVSGVLKIVGYLCCTDGFVDHAKVLNGASEFLVEALGKEKGMHTRSVMGVQSLPLGAPVALEVTLEVAGG